MSRRPTKPIMRRKVTGGSRSSPLSTSADQGSLCRDELVPEVGVVLERPAVADVQRVAGIDPRRPGGHHVGGVELAPVVEGHSFPKGAGPHGGVLVRLAAGGQRRL